MFLADKITDSQHAYLPGRGTLSAWEMLLNKIQKYKYIYEIDLKQCFPSIRGEYISDELENLGVPEEYINYIEMINRSTPNPIVKDQVVKKMMNEPFKEEHSFLSV